MNSRTPFIQFADFNHHRYDLFHDVHREVISIYGPKKNMIRSDLKTGLSFEAIPANEFEELSNTSGITTNSNLLVGTRYSHAALDTSATDSFWTEFSNGDNPSDSMDLDQNEPFVDADRELVISIPDGLPYFESQPIDEAAILENLESINDTIARAICSEVTSNC